MANPFLDYILSQPAIVPKCYDAGAACADWVGAPGTIALVGSGSSTNALMSVVPALRRNARVWLANPLDFSAAVEEGQRFDRVLVLSQSGASQTSVAAARDSVAAGLETLAITADAHAPIADVGARTLVMPIGIETIGPKTVGYTGSVASLLGLFTAFAGLPALDPDAIATGIGDALTAAHAPAARLAGTLGDVDHLMFAARGAHLATATEAALKIAETTGVPTAAYPVEELLHGRLHMMTPRSRVFILTDTASDRALARQTRAALERYGLVCLIADMISDREGGLFAGLPRLAAPGDLLGGIVPFQLLANAMALGRGLDPAAMPYPDMSRALALKHAANS